MSLSVTITHRLGNTDFDLSFDAPDGLTVLFGRSGSGKTTVINAVAGLLTPNSGRIAVQNRVLYDSVLRVNLPVHKRRLGYVFQEARLFPHISVAQNLTYGSRFAPPNAQASKRDMIVEMLGLGALLTRRPGDLSGGEKQRVAIGRALLAGPELLLADEPLAALDEPRKAEILPYFETLRDELKLPILYVSHSAVEVARLATTVVAMENGKVARMGTATDVLSDPSFTPTGVRAAGAILEATVAAHHSDGLTELDAAGIPLFLPKLDKPAGARVRLRIAAQDVILSRSRPEGLSALNVLPGTIEEIRAGGGPGAILSLTTPAGRVLARITQRSVSALDLSVGTTCHAVVKTVSVAPADIGGA